VGKWACLSLFGVVVVGGCGLCFVGVVTCKKDAKSRRLADGSVKNVCTVRALRCGVVGGLLGCDGGESGGGGREGESGGSTKCNESCSGEFGVCVGEGKVLLYFNGVVGGVEVLSLVLFASVLATG